MVWQHCSLAAADDTPVSINSCSTTNSEREREKAKAKAQRQSVGAQNIGVAFVVLICVCVPNVFGLYVLSVLAPATKEIKYIF